MIGAAFFLTVTIILFINTIVFTKVTIWNTKSLSLLKFIKRWHKLSRGWVEVVSQKMILWIMGRIGSLKQFKKGWCRFWMVLMWIENLPILQEILIYVMCHSSRNLDPILPVVLKIRAFEVRSFWFYLIKCPFFGNFDFEGLYF